MSINFIFLDREWVAPLPTCRWLADRGSKLFETVIGDDCDFAVSEHSAAGDFVVGAPAPSKESFDQWALALSKRLESEWISPDIESFGDASAWHAFGEFLMLAPMMRDAVEWVIAYASDPARHAIRAPGDADSDEYWTAMFALRRTDALRTLLDAEKLGPANLLTDDDAKCSKPAFSDERALWKAVATRAETTVHTNLPDKADQEVLESWNGVLHPRLRWAREHLFRKWYSKMASFPKTSLWLEMFFCCQPSYLMLAYASTCRTTPDIDAIRKEVWDACGPRMTRVDKFDMFRRCISIANLTCLRELAGRMGGTLSAIVFEKHNFFTSAYRGRRWEDGDRRDGMPIFVTNGINTAGPDDETCMQVLDEFLNGGMFPEFWNHVHVAMDHLASTRPVLVKRIIRAKLFRLSPMSPLALQYMMNMIDASNSDMDLARFALHQCPHVWLSIGFGSPLKYAYMKSSCLQFQLAAIAVAVDPVFVAQYLTEDEHTLADPVKLCYTFTNQTEIYDDPFRDLVWFHRSRGKENSEKVIESFPWYRKCEDA